MQEIPEKVKGTLQKLKEKQKHYIHLKIKDGSYYAFEITSRWDPLKRRTKSISLYLGKIDSNGEFTSPLRRKQELKGISTLDEYISYKEKFEEQAEKFQIESAYEPVILEALSTDAREGIAAMSKRLNMAYNTVHYWIKRLESKYGIRYTIDYRFLDNFNLYKFLVVARFKNGRPDADTVRKLIKNEPRIQLGLWTRGSYDLFLFVLASKPFEVESMVYKLRSDPALAKYPSYWYSSYYTQGHGYIPLRDEFFDLIKTRVWQRTKETPRKGPMQIFKREYATMRELNSSGLLEFNKIDEKYNLKSGSAQYTYHQLLKHESLLGITITMSSPPIKDIAVIMMPQINMKKFNLHKTEYFAEVISDENTPLNKYIFEGDVGSPYGVMLIAPLYKEGDLELLEHGLNAIKGVKVQSSVVSETLIGSLGFRKIDLTKSWIYKAAAEELKDKKAMIN